MAAREQLLEELALFGVEPTAEQAELLLRHLELVIEKNKVLNLTRIADEAAGVTLHIVDSLLLLDAVNATDGCLFDLGTGAGFPGIPLVVMTGKHALLNDSVAKKIAAVSEFVDELGLGELIETSAERCEVLGKSRRGEFGCVTARAVASLPVLIEYASPLLKHGGRLVATKGNLSPDELSSGLRAAKLCGMAQIASQSFELPREMGHREILVFEKVAKPQVKLPRQIGKAKKEPLA